MARKYSRAISGAGKDYTRKNAKPNIYRAEWGTRGSKASKECTSIAIAKHPLLAWANDLKAILVFKGHTVEERNACLELIREIDSLGEFKQGDVTFDLPVPSDGMYFQARIVRIA